MKLTGDFAPELLWILFSFAIELLILFDAFYLSLLAKLSRWAEESGLFEDRVD
jgi:hypothetical protein